MAYFRRRTLVDALSNNGQRNKFLKSFTLILLGASVSLLLANADLIINPQISNSIAYIKQFFVTSDGTSSGSVSVILDTSGVFAKGYCNLSGSLCKTVEDLFDIDTQLSGINLQITALSGLYLTGGQVDAKINTFSGNLNSLAKANLACTQNQLPQFSGSVWTCGTIATVAETDPLWTAVSGNYTLNSFLSANYYTTGEINAATGALTNYITSNYYTKIISDTNLSSATGALTNYITSNYYTTGQINAKNYLTGEKDPDFTTWINTNPLASYATTSSLSNYATTSSLSNYVTNTILSTALSNYVTNTILSTALGSYVSNSSLSTSLASYVTSSSLSTSLASYVTNSSLSTSLASYVTSSSLSSTLSSYLTYESEPDFNNWINTDPLASYATNSSLSNYVSNSSLSSTLGGYVSNSSLSTSLSSYATTASLSSYVTNSSLSTTLGGYVTNSSLSTTLGNYATTASLSKSNWNSAYTFVNNASTNNRLFIDTTNDRIGIGTGAPGYLLTVAGTGLFTNSVFAEAFLYNSDKRLKTNIVEITDPLTKIAQLHGYTFDWKDSGRHDIGVIAQEVESVFPEAVVTKENGFKTVNYPSLVAPIIQAIKALYTKYLDQQDQIDVLKSQVDELKTIVNQIK